MVNKKWIGVIGWFRGESVGQTTNGINFSDSSLLLDAICQGLGVGLVSQLLAYHAKNDGLLLPLSTNRVSGVDWAWLIHRDSEQYSPVQYFCQWLEKALAECTDGETCPGFMADKK